MINLLRPFFYLIGLSWISILGAAIVTSAFLADGLLILGELLFFESHPYIGLAVYMLFPGMMMFGLLLIPFGLWWRIRKLGKIFSLATLKNIAEMSLIERPGNLFQVVGVLTLVNLVGFALVGYRGFHFTESEEFCGQLCHKVMLPELSAYNRSPHSEISCVECHIGPGAGWFVKSKLSGMRQVLAVTFNTYSKPIETPLHNLRPARDVCEICHRPEIFHGNRLETIEHYEPDELNTKTYTVLNMRVGSGGERANKAHGIHWHVDPVNQLRYYASDQKREKIVWIELRNPDGSRQVWTRPNFAIPEEELLQQEVRLMDCLDCHNRPTHIFLSPAEALDERFATGQLDASIPWLRKTAEELISPVYASAEEAMVAIARLPELYQGRHPEIWDAHQEGIRQAAPVLQEIHRQFVFPEMNIQWNTYTSQIGHPTENGARCFRCHDGLFKDQDGQSITIDCVACHYVLANRERDPRILKLMQKEERVFF